MSFLYPRTIAITRPNPDTGSNSGAGIQGYSAVTEGNETTILTAIPAAIQSVRERGTPEGKTPSDAPTRSQWNIYIPLSAMPTPGVILDRDIATDDLNRRFVIIASDPMSLGYRLRCELLEA